MATRNHTKNSTQTNVAFVARWDGLLAGDDGDALHVTQYTDKGLQVSGTFGGASLRFEGSNNGTDWATLSDPQGNDLLLTSAKIEMVTEATVYVRPVVVGGDGTTSLTVNLLVKE
jgi:hypothetical protein